jgi:hypothetical protein
MSGVAPVCLLVGGVALCLAGCAQEPQQCSLVLAASVPMALIADDSKISVPVTLDGAVLQVIVDTGSERTMLDRKALTGISETGAVGLVSGFGGARWVGVAQLPKLQIGDLHGSVPALVIDMGDQPPAPGTVGALGIDILGLYDVDLDIAGGELGFYRRLGDCAAPVTGLRGALYAVAELPQSPDDLRPFVPVQIGGQSFVAILDTGSDTASMTRSAARRLGLTDDVLGGDTPDQVRGVGPGVDQARQHLMTLSLGDLTVQNVPVDVVPTRLGTGVDMLLGLDLAKRIHFWLSASSHMIVMQYPPLPTPPPAGAKEQ